MAQDRVAIAKNLFSGGGEMGALMRSIDWSKTPFGPVEQWPQSLRSALSICLNSRFPIAIYWGPQCLLLYNDAWRPIVGDKHPQSLGRPGQEVWPEIWSDIGPEFEQVFATGEGIFHSDELLAMHRYGYTEECFFEYTFNPIQGEGGGIDGIFNVVSETTYRVLNDRRAQLLQEVASRTGTAKTAEAAYTLIAEALRTDPADIPLFLFYQVEPGGKYADLCNGNPFPLDAAIAPTQVDLTGDVPEGWPIARCVQTAQPQEIYDVMDRFGRLPGSAWPEVPQEAMVLPIMLTGQPKVAGVLVAVASPRLRLDERYRDFLRQIASQTAIMIANARSYEEERQRAEQLAELDRAKTAFFSNVSHEFRTPLTLMLGPVEEALQSAQDDEQRDRLQLIQRNALRLQKLVNTLLDFSRIEAGRIEATYEPTDLAELTRDLTGIFRSAIEGAGLSLQVDCPPLQEPIYVDRDMWEKIVLNLLSNAFKFTFAGEIRVSLQVNEDFSTHPPIHPSTHPPLVPHVILEVRDTGIGIPAAEIPRLFDRFHRVQGAQGRTYEGSGIGLALVQELVRLHGGAVAVTSTVGQGTCFTVSIPTGWTHLPSDRLRHAASVTATPTTLSAIPYVEEARRWLPDDNGQLDGWSREADLQPLFPSSHLCPKILLADDNADMRDYVKRLLSQQYAVETVGNGVAALTAIRQQLPDLVLTDVMMPRMDGFELLHELRSDPTTQELPIILLSARAGEEARMEGLEAGADDYLIKPFSARELLVRVDTTLKLAQMRQEVARYEQKLRLAAEAGQQKISIILDSITDAFVALDREWRYTYINEQATQILHKTREELLGKQVWEEVFPNRVGTLSYQELHRAMAEQVAVVYEDYNPVLNIWFEVHAYPSSEGLAIYFQDVSDRKKAEQALRESEERIRQLTENINTVFFMTEGFSDTSPGRVVYVSSAYERIWGRSCESLYENTRSWLEAVHCDDRERVQQTLSSMARAEFDQEFRIFRPNGEMRWVHVRVFPVHNEQGEVYRAAGIIEDITERKQSEAEREYLLFQEQRYVAQLQGLTEAALAMNSALSVEEVLQVINKQAASIIGTHQSVSSMTIGQNWAKGITSIHMSEKYAQWWDYDEKPDGSGIYACVCHMNRPVRMTQAELEAHPRWNNFGKAGAKHPPMRGWLAAPLVGREGQNIGLIQLSDRFEGEFTETDEAILVQLAQMASVAVENAQLYEAEQQARAAAEAARKEAQASNRIKDEFLAVLSHELRSPLNPILGWSALLQKNTLDATKTAQALATIQRNAKLQSELIEDLLDVSRILQGKLSLNVAPVSLVSVIRAAMETVRLAAEAKAIQLDASLNGEGGLVSGDSTRLQQVVWNLLSNAVKFTPEGGRVTIGLEYQNAHALITVTDTGQGIAADFLPYVFDYFRQADGATTRKFGGLGLGLAIVRHLVELHGGFIRATSPGEGMGATFTVKLPLLQVGSPDDEAGKPPEIPLDLSGIQVLVVEDDTDTRELVAFLIEQHGATVTAVASADEGLVALTQNKPDILLSDIGMPEMDGYMLMRQVRALPPELGGDIPAIALTAYAGEIDYQQAMNVGFQRHIPKPVDPVVLVGAIASLVKQPK